MKLSLSTEQILDGELFKLIFSATILNKQNFNSISKILKSLQNTFEIFLIIILILLKLFILS